MNVIALSAQSHLIHGTVIDKESGEPLIGVTVTVTKANRTITNVDGDFEMMANDNDIVTFSFIGFAEQKYKASELPPLVKLSESSFQLDNVVITAKDDLAEIIKNTKKNYIKGANHKSHFFNRVTIENEYGHREMLENFLEARDVVAFRDVKICSGDYWETTESGGRTSFSLETTNIDKFFLLSPFSTNRNFWGNIISPIHSEYSSAQLHKVYTVKREAVTDGGRTILRYDFTANDKDSRSVIDGILYVDGESMMPIRFEGTLHKIPIRVSYVQEKSKSINLNVKFDITYTNDNGRCVIDNMIIDAVCPLFSLKSSMINIEDSKLNWGFSYPVRSNLVKEVMSVGHNPELSKHIQFIQRTEEDEDLAQRTAPVKSDLQPSEVPHERAYVQLDNTGYFLGETIWFKAYVMRTDLQKMTNLSKVLYVELLDPSGNVVATRKLKLKDGMANGNIELTQPLSSGFYEVRAYTRYMTSWGADACYSKVIPVFNKPKTPGDYSNPAIDMVSYYHRLPNYRVDAADAALPAPADSIVAVEMLASSAYTLDDENAQISVKALNSFIKPYDTVELTIHAAPYSRLSVSVTDADAIVNGRKDDITSVLMSPDVLPLKPADGKEPIMEKGLRLEGKLVAKKKKDRPRTGNADLAATLYHANGRSTTGVLKTDENGHFFSDLPDFPGQWNLFMESSKDSAVVDAYIGIDRHFSPAPKVMSKEDVKPVPVDTANIIRWNYDAATYKETFESIHRLANVDVIGKKRRVKSAPWYSDANAARYASIFYDCEKEQEILLDSGEEIFGLSEFLAHRNPLFSNVGIDAVSPLIALGGGSATGGKEIVDYSEYDPCDNTHLATELPPGCIRFWSDGLTYKNRPIIWLVDNVFCTITGLSLRSNFKIPNVPCSIDDKPVMCRVETINVLNNNNPVNALTDLPAFLDEVRTVYISEDIRQCRDAFYCEEINERNPVIVSVYTQGTKKHRPGTRSTYYQGYDVPNVFVTSKIAKMTADEEDFRRTVYWNPNLRTNKYGDVTISFPNTAVCKNMQINIEGVTKDGRCISLKKF